MSQQRQQHFLVCYDISHNGERTRVERLLLGWGHRVQKSVFKVVTTRYGLAQLKTGLENLHISSGSVLIFRLQLPASTIALGQPFHDPDRELAYII